MPWLDRIGIGQNSLLGHNVNSWFILGLFHYENIGCCNTSDFKYWITEGNYDTCTCKFASYCFLCVKFFLDFCLLVFSL